MAIISDSQLLDTYYPNHKYKDIRLWFREDWKYTAFYSLVGLYLYPWGSALGNPYSGKEAPAELSLATSETLQESDNIVIISSNPKHDEILSEANRSISHPNAKRELVTSKTIHQGSAQFFL